LLSAGYATGDSGKSAGGYHFGQMSGTKLDVSDAEGYDFGAQYLGGRIKLKGDVFCVKNPELN